MKAEMREKNFNSDEIKEQLTRMKTYIEQELEVTGNLNHARITTYFTKLHRKWERQSKYNEIADRRNHLILLGRLKEMKNTQGNQAKYVYGLLTGIATPVFKGYGYKETDAKFFQKIMLAALGKDAKFDPEGLVTHTVVGGMESKQRANRDRLFKVLHEAMGDKAEELFGPENRGLFWNMAKRMEKIPPDEEGMRHQLNQGIMHYLHFFETGQKIPDNVKLGNDIKGFAEVVHKFFKSVSKEFKDYGVDAPDNIVGLLLTHGLNHAKIRENQKAFFAALETADPKILDVIMAGDHNAVRTEAFHRIVNGKHRIPLGRFGLDFEAAGAKDIPINMTAKNREFSISDLLQFKTFDELMKFYADWGNLTVDGLIRDAMSMDSRSLGIVEVLGTKPKQMIRTLIKTGIKDLEDDFRDMGVAGVRKIVNPKLRKHIQIRIAKEIKRLTAPWLGKIPKGKLVEDAGLRTGDDGILRKMTRAEEIEYVKFLNNEIKQPSWWTVNHTKRALTHATVKEYAEGITNLEFKGILKKGTFAEEARAPKTIYDAAGKVKEYAAVDTGPPKTLPAWIEKPALDISPAKQKLMRKELDTLRIWQDSSNNPVMRALGTLTGENMMPRNQGVASAVKNTLAAMQMSKLGAASINSLNDFNFAAQVVESFGGVFSKSLGGVQGRYFRPGKEIRAFPDFFQGKLSEADLPYYTKVLKALDIGFARLTQGFVHKHSATDDFSQGSNAVSRWLPTFFKWNGLGLHTDTVDGAIAYMLSSLFGEHKDFKWDALRPVMSNRLKGLGVDKAEWDALRKGAQNFKDNEGGDNWFLTLDGAEELADDIVMAYIRETQGIRGTIDQISIRQARRTLASKLATVYRYATDTFKPGTKEASMFTANLPADNAVGIFLRFLGLFKGFLTAVTRKQLAPLIWQSGSANAAWHVGELFRSGTKSPLFAMGRYIAITIMYGMISASIYALVRGRTPSWFEEDKPKYNFHLLLGWMARGGGLGLYGDILTGEADRFGRGYIETLAGPVIGLGSQLTKTLVDIYREGQNPLPQLLKIASKELPFANIFYIRGVLDYFILYNLHEFANPGYNRRTERILKKELGQEYYIPNPSEIISRGGAWPWTIAGRLLDEAFKIK